MSLSKSDFLYYSEDHSIAILHRDKAREIIKAKNLEKLDNLWSIRRGPGDLHLTINPLYPWSWSMKQIGNELKKFNIPFVREELEFFGSDVDSYPLFVLKEGFDKAIIIAPTEWKEEDEEIA